MSFDIIKIDRSFLQNLNNKDLTSISATKLIADEFNAAIVAEGIETQKELETLKALDIRYIQGFLFSKPLPSEQVMHWMENFSTGSKDQTAPSQLESDYPLRSSTLSD